MASGRMEDGLLSGGAARGILLSRRDMAPLMGVSLGFAAAE